MNERVQELERQLLWFADDPRSGLALPGAAGIRAEIRYGQVYQQLVRLGARPQLRRKYRLG